MIGPKPWGGGGGAWGLLPYFSYIGMCRLIGYGFRGGQSIGYPFWHCGPFIGYLNHGHCYKLELSVTKLGFTLELYT